VPFGVKEEERISLRLGEREREIQGRRKVTFADVTLLAFTASNSIRVIAYVPQIWKAATDTHGAQAISFTTWALFLASHLTTAVYAVVNREDWMMATVFLANGAGCFAILALAAWRRATYRGQAVTRSRTVVPFARRAA
jgi:hypothetical protein